MNCNGIGAAGVAAGAALAAYLWRLMAVTQKRVGAAEAELARAEREREELARQRALDAAADRQAEADKAADRADKPPVAEPTEADADALVKRVTREGP